MAAGAHRNTLGKALLNRVSATTPTVVRAWVDQGFKADVVDHGTDLDIDVEIVKRHQEQTGFVVQAKRWVVEQANGILMYDRYLVREYTVDPRSSESRVYWAAVRRIVRRLIGTGPQAGAIRSRPRHRTPRWPPPWK